MKALQKIVPLIFLLAITISCSKDDEKKIEDKSTGGTYINYSVAGNQKNGTFNIVGDYNSSEMNVTGIIVPNDNGDYTALVDFFDLSQMLNAGLAVPPTTGLYEITDTNPYSYAVGFGFEDISLQEKAISVNITEIEFDGVLLLHIKGTFTGTAVYISDYDENDNPIEEPHLVDGEFQYNSPAYNL